MSTFLCKMTFLCPFILLLLSHPAAAATITVCSSGCNYASIQAAVNAASDGDEVVVSPGTYVENIDFSGDDSVPGNVPKAITVRSLDPDDPLVVAGTIINGSGGTNKSAVIFNSGEGPSAVLKGFTITGAATTDNNLGGGVTIVADWSSGALKPSSPTVSNCNISGNSAVSGGGMLISRSSATISNCVISNNTGSGIVSSYSTATIKDCTISGNTAGDGGGIVLANSGGSIINSIIVQNKATRIGGFGGGIRAWESDTFISRCTISRNTSADFGGGLAISRTPAPTIESCLIAENSSTNGGGIYCGYLGSASPSILNCTIVGNAGSRGGGLYFEGQLNAPSHPIVKNSIVWNNETGIFLFDSSPVIAYSDIQGGYSGDGNINVDPEFAGADDFRLTNASPCIDTGDNNAVLGTYDRDGLPRIMDDNGDGKSVVDMGAYEGSVSSNQSPVANAGIDQTVHVGINVTLDGSESTDPDGNYPLTYSWSFVSKPAGSAAVLSDPAASGTDFIADLPGDYVIALVVTDSLGLSSKTDEVTVSTDNTAPVANAGPDQTVIVIDTIVQLDGNQSWDVDGDDLSYLWAFISRPAGSTATLSDFAAADPTFTADVKGSYVLRLIVSDGWASSDPDDPDASVVVSFNNIQPVANAGDNQSVVQRDIVYLDSTRSTDANLDPLTYAWIFVSKPAGSAAVLSDPAASGTDFIADLPGEYIVSLVVNDGFVDSAPDNLAILAVAHPDSLIEKLQELITAVNSLADEDLKNKNLKKALTNKVNALIELVINGDYQEALDKLTNDILAKTDGCAAAKAPDRNDWLVNCDAQSQVYPLIVEIVDLLSVLT